MRPSGRTLALLALASVAFVAVDVGSRMAILTALGPDHVPIVLVTMVVARLLVILGFALVGRRIVLRTRSEARAPDGTRDAARPQS
jgi:hypothetical protein